MDIWQRSPQLWDVSNSSQFVRAAEGNDSLVPRPLPQSSLCGRGLGTRLRVANANICIEEVISNMKKSTPYWAPHN